MKKTLWLLLCLFLLFAYSPVSVWAEDLEMNDIENISVVNIENNENADSSGSCGENVFWSFDDVSNTLTISGQGAMNDYNNFETPWRDYKIENIIICENVISIGQYCFANCIYLQSVQLPQGLTGINAYAFWGCDNLIVIDLPQGLLTLGEEAFASCSSLEEIVIPGTVGVISERVFLHCDKLKNVAIQNGVKSIDNWAFINCSSLSDIFIPESIIRIENNSFLGCTDLKDIEVDINNTEYSSTDGILYSKEGTELLLCPEGKMQCVVPDGVISIGKSAFYNCVKLASLTLPESLKHIDSSAFHNCASLTEIKLPSGIKTIYSGTFADCTNLRNIYIPVSVGSILGDAFANCVGLEKIIYAGSETQWGQIKINNGNAELNSAEIVCQNEDSTGKPDDNKPDDSTNKPEDNDKPDQPTNPNNLSITKQAGGLGSKITVQITGGHWLTVQVRRAGSIAITSMQAQGQGIVDMAISIAAGSIIQIWETESEMTFTNGVPDNKILATAVENI